MEERRERTGRRAAPRRSTAPPLLVATVVHADEPLTFADLQEACGLPKSTTSRLLTALERVRAARARRRRVSYVAGSLFWLYAARHDPWRGAGPAGPARRWRRSARRPARPCNLGVARGDRVVQVAQVDSPLPARHPRLDRGRRARRTAPRSARCSCAWDALAAAARAARAADRRRRSPTRAALRRRRRARPRARLGRHRRRARGRPDRRRRTRAADRAATVVAALGVSGPTARLERPARRARTAVETTTPRSCPTCSAASTHEEGAA